MRDGRRAWDRSRVADPLQDTSLCFSSRASQTDPENCSRGRSVVQAGLRTATTRLERRGFIAKLMASVAWLAWWPSRSAHAQSSTIVRLSDLDEPWSSVQFTYRTATESVPGIIIRLPDGTLYAASRLCPHQGCTIIYYKNAKEVNDSYTVDVVNPALACPCHLSVFDLAKGGKVVGGPASRSPFKFEIRVAREDVHIERLERTGP